MNTSKAIPNTSQTQWVEIAAGKKRKLKRLNPRDELDRLISWYEKNKPDLPHVLPGGIALSKIDLDRFAQPTAEGVWTYRGWRITQADTLPRKEKRLKISK